MDKKEKKRNFIQKGLVVSLFSIGMLLYGADYYVAVNGSGASCSASVPCDIGTAIADASDGDRLILAAGTYTGSGNNVIELTKGVSLYGGWDGNNPPTINPKQYITTISGEKIRRVIEVNATDVSLTLDGLHIVDGNATGLGGYTAYGYTRDVGGGIFVEEANVTVENCFIEYNIVKSWGSKGGGIFLHNSDGQVAESIIQHNIAETGGGISIIGGTARIVGNEITHNNATGGGGGGIYAYEGLHLISNNLIADNNTSAHGGGISNPYSMILENNLILRNRAEERGGGIDLWYDDNHHINNIVAQNYAPQGGGIWAGGSDATLIHTTVADNKDENGDDNGIYVDKADNSSYSNMTFINTIISGEKEGIHVADGSHAALEGTLFWGNTANIVTEGSATVDAGSVTVTGNPAFKDPTHGNYYITGFSAAIDAGVNGNVTEDIDGDTRPMGSGYDIGADETQRGTLTPLYYLLF